MINHEVHKSKNKGRVLKIDYEKAYDKVNLDFLYEMLELRGFGPKIISLVKQMTQGGSVGVKVNDDIGHYFRTKKSLRQGDPLSPLLFNIIVDMLSILIARAKEDGQVGSLIPHLVEGGGGVPSFDTQMIQSFLWNTILKRL